MNEKKGNKPRYNFYENGSGDIYMEDKSPENQDYFMKKRKYRKNKWKIKKL